MASEVGCGVTNKDQIAYERTAPPLMKLKDKEFHFEIQQHSDSEQVGVFWITEGGNTVRQNTSKPFPNGAIKKKSLKVNSTSCVVKVKADCDINDYFP